MNPAEVVVGEMQRQGSLEVRQLLAEGVRQPDEPPALHPDGQVLSLDVGCRDMPRIRVAREGHVSGGLTFSAPIAGKASVSAYPEVPSWCEWGPLGGPGAGLSSALVAFPGALC